MSSHWYFMNFQDNKELLETHVAGIARRRSGALLVAFFDVDWQGFYEKCDSLKLCKDLPGEFAALYRAICSQLEPLHPLLDELARGQLMGDFTGYAMEAWPREPDAPLWHYIKALTDGGTLPKLSREEVQPLLTVLKERMGAFALFASKLTELVDTVLDAGGVHGELTPMQRYCLMRLSSWTYLQLAQKLYPLLESEYRVSVAGKPFDERLDKRPPTPEEIAEMANHTVQAATFRATDELTALVLWELDEMAASGLSLRRCDYCGRYFLPFSVVSRYCARPLVDQPDKCCKDVAAAKKHQEAVNADEAKALYTLVNNRNQMRARRRKHAHPAAEQEYSEWKVDAKRLLAQVQEGTLSYEEFAREIE